MRHFFVLDITFPASPVNGQAYTFNGRSWVYNGVAWERTA